jgi:2'-hydroxyisoflavone reductase
VTLFNCGKTDTDIFPQAETLIGDRDGNLEALKGRTWDAVLDVNGYVPRIVGNSVEILKDAAEHYTFISTISVYADETPEHYDEFGPLKTIDDPTVEEIRGDTYGELKVLCEQVVQEAFPGKSLIVRPGLVFGPGDYTYRFNYWLARVAEGGEVLAPGEPSGPVQFVDVRDLAAWTIHNIEQQTAGTFHITGPKAPLTFEDFLTTVREVSSSDARFVWASEEFLLKQVSSHSKICRCGLHQSAPLS